MEETATENKQEHVNTDKRPTIGSLE
jgi:hypothetical protein